MMLDTRERSLLLETLRPPVGYSIDRAIGTSYTLDLTTLLTAPLAFTFFNYHDEDGDPTADPVALLEALRRHAERITIFCQAGAISVPKPNQLFVYLEQSVVEVKAPRKGGIFHPKIWLLRFVAEGQPIRYRFLCLSRNLTFARAWDTCVALDGELTSRTNGFAANRPLGEFVKALPGLAVRRLSASVRADVERMASEVRRVRFETPAPFKKVFFHSMGLGGRANWPFPKGARLMVVAPYLTERTIRKCHEVNQLEILVSRPEALASIPAELLPEKGTYVLSPLAEMDARESSGEEDPTAAEADGKSEKPVEITGLHAKLYVAQTGQSGHVFTGSANATTAGFERSVEFLVELVGGPYACGIRSVLGDPADDKQSALSSLLQEYQPVEDSEPPDEIQQELDQGIEQLAREIAGRKLTSRVEELEGRATYSLTLLGQPPEIPEEANIWLWPLTLSGEQRRDLLLGGPVLVRFEELSFEALTAFWAFEIEMRREGRRTSRRFAVATTLEGAPRDRRERLLRSLLKNRRQVLRLLLLLLADEGLDISQLIAGTDDGSGGGGRWAGGWDEPTLLEELLQSLSQDPRRLDQAARLIDDLRRTQEGAELLPSDLDAIWVPIWKARQELR